MGLAIAVVGGAGLLAVPSNRLGQRLRAPAIFLLAAAMAVHFPGAGPTSASASRRPVSPEPRGPQHRLTRRREAHQA
jgi:hypothetical protein